MLDPRVMDPTFPDCLKDRLNPGTLDPPPAQRLAQDRCTGTSHLGRMSPISKYLYFARLSEPEQRFAPNDENFAPAGVSTDTRRARRNIYGMKYLYTGKEPITPPQFTARPRFWGFWNSSAPYFFSLLAPHRPLDFSFPLVLFCSYFIYIPYRLCIHSFHRCWDCRCSLFLLSLPDLHRLASLRDLTS